MSAPGRRPPHRELSEGSGLLRLWAGIVAGPFAVLGVQAAGYVALTTECGPARGLLVHAAHAVGLAAIAGAFLLARREWRYAGGGWPDDGHGAVGRGRWMAAAGMAACGIFALVLVAQWLPAFVLSPCSPG